LIDDTPVTPGEERTAYDSYDVSKQIIVDCENALSEWTLDSAAVKARLSVRQPRKHRVAHTGENAGDLSAQDRPLDRESSLWVPAAQHAQVRPARSRAHG
jgi:sphingolipid long chain base-responsive protein PIL1/LSP1